MASLSKVHLLVIADKSSPELQVLSTLPSNVEIVAIGKPNELDHLTLQQWDSISILLNFGTGVKAARKEDIQAIWSNLHNLKWMHSTIAGLEHLLFDELIQSSVILTNAKQCPAQWTQQEIPGSS
ncbi:hypothetical protein CEUSTIGMA_g5152.t1 [Chlamydomonas eustigma]|uniref:D-isomer specific 2-hydroxyacid dehydrogenase catalytic domain-containing protein n=1 Tax=Chlamydomonas eustigma TaxID=1157962 RepID=A0A250X463_9CHLO|nr:hypothetical protein CEUSTIGMA_g5152.t1 [Chlamydomonas eustigma]|eukprot:GAX77709.1 hypothetical protein CEUSTIGMA_g5152.t1 [Chlamydomonas eustigma]